MDAKEDNAMTQYNKITALYSRLSVGDEDRDGGESNSIVNQKAFLERYARQEKLTNIRHYIDDDESGRFFDRSAYVRMMDDVESGKIGIVVMKDMTRWGRDYLQVGNAMEIFRRNKVRFIAVNKLNGEKKQLTDQYYALKDEVKEVEQIRRNVYSILREENGRKQPAGIPPTLSKQLCPKYNKVCYDVCHQVLQVL